MGANTSKVEDIIQQKNIGELKKWVKQNDPNERDEKGASVLLRCVEAEWPEGAMILVRQDDIKCVPSNDRRFPLLVALEKGFFASLSLSLCLSRILR